MRSEGVLEGCTGVLTISAVLRRVCFLAERTDGVVLGSMGFNLTIGVFFALLGVCKNNNILYTCHYKLILKYFFNGLIPSRIKVVLTLSLQKVLAGVLLNVIT